MAGLPHVRRHDQARENNGLATEQQVLYLAPDEDPASSKLAAGEQPTPRIVVHRRDGDVQQLSNIPGQHDVGGSQ